MLRSLIAALLVNFLPLTATADDKSESPFRSVRCRGNYPRHLQGVCTNNKDAIYWCFTNMLVKTDVDGMVQEKSAVSNHHGDLCYHAGKVYVAVNFGKFNQHGNMADSWVYVYDGETLAQTARHPVRELVYGAGGIAVRDGRFFVVGGLPKDVDENYIYEYDERFSFIRRHTLKSGNTQMGIQTIEFAADRWWFGCYGDPRVLFKADVNFSATGRWNLDAALGLVGLPDGRLLVASGSRTQDGYQGEVFAYVSDPAAGFTVASRSAEARPQAAEFPGPYWPEDRELRFLKENIASAIKDWKSFLASDVGRRWTPAVLEAHMRRSRIGTTHNRPWRFRQRLQSEHRVVADRYVLDDFLEVYCPLDAAKGSYGDIVARLRNPDTEHSWLYQQKENGVGWMFQAFGPRTLHHYFAQSNANMSRFHILPIEPVGLRLKGRLPDGTTISLFDSGLEQQDAGNLRQRGLWLTSGPGSIARHLPLHPTSEPWTAAIPSDAEIKAALKSWSQHLKNVNEGDPVSKLESLLRDNYLNRSVVPGGGTGIAWVVYTLDDFLQVRCNCTQELIHDFEPLVERRVPCLTEGPDVSAIFPFPEYYERRKRSKLFNAFQQMKKDDSDLGGYGFKGFGGVSNKSEFAVPEVRPFIEEGPTDN